VIDEGPGVFSPLYNPSDAHFWVTIALLVFLVILWRAKVPAMLIGALDGVGAKIQAQLDEAARLRQEAEALLLDIHKRREETERAAADMMEAAQADAERLRQDAAVRLEADLRRRTALAEAKIALAESQAAALVMAAAADMAAEAAEAVLAARIAGASADPLIDQGLARLGAQFS
jgi:F-type H+-transporting ATPase subunit b